MKEFFKKVFGWLGQSNRMKHLSACFVIAAACGVDAGIIAGLSVEYKDWAYQGQPKGKNIFQEGAGWDWLDVAASTIGAILGGIVHYLIFKRVF